MATGGNPTCVAARCVVYVSTEAGKAPRHPISVIIQFGDACLCVCFFVGTIIGLICDPFKLFDGLWLKSSTYLLLVLSCYTVQMTNKHTDFKLCLGPITTK